MGKFNPEEHFMDLKGKKYLQVMWRLVWFREDHPDWDIVTELKTYDPVNGLAVFEASIYDNEGKHRESGHGSETSKDFGDFLEKAETKAVGRALAMLGYGTQFAPELDEGERIVDSPVAFNRAQPKAPPVTEVKKEATSKSDLLCEECEAPITPKEYEYSAKVYGVHLCRNCQKNANKLPF